MVGGGGELKKKKKQVLNDRQYEREASLRAGVTLGVFPSPPMQCVKLLKGLVLASLYS